MQFFGQPALTISVICVSLCVFGLAMVVAERSMVIRLSSVLWWAALWRLVTAVQQMQMWSLIPLHMADKNTVYCLTEEPVFTVITLSHQYYRVDPTFLNAGWPVSRPGSDGRIVTVGGHRYWYGKHYVVTEKCKWLRGQLLTLLNQSLWIASNERITHSWSL